MANLRNFVNAITNDNRLYTAEDIGNMSADEFRANEKAIDYQLNNIGISRESELIGNPDVIYVRAYTRADGTKVKAHYRSKPDGIESDNYQNNGLVTESASNVNNLNIGNSGIKNINTKNMKPADFSYLENTNLITKHLAKFNAEKNANRPDARELMNIALSGFENLPEHPEFNVCQPEAVDYVNNQLDIKDSKGLSIPKGWHGVIYDKNSGFAKRLSNSPELRTQIISKYDQKSKKFTTDQIGIGFSEDKNLNYSIGHGTILNPQIDNGEFKGILFDKYDYKWLSKEELPNLETRKLNNSAYTIQTFKKLTNYYVIIPISFKIWK